MVVLKVETSHQFESTRMTTGVASDNSCPVLWSAGDKISLVNAEGSRQLLSTAQVPQSDDMSSCASLNFRVAQSALAGISKVRFFCGNANVYGKPTIPQQQLQKGLGIQNTDLLPYTYAFSHSMSLKETMSLGMRHPMAYVAVRFHTKAYGKYILKSIAIENLESGTLAGTCSNVNGSTDLASAIQGIVSGTESSFVQSVYSDKINVPTTESEAYFVTLPTGIKGGETAEAQEYAVYFEMEDGDRTVFTKALFKTILYPSAVNVLNVGEITTDDAISHQDGYSADAGSLNEYLTLREGAYVPVDYEVYDYPDGIDVSTKYAVSVEGLDATVLNANPGGLNLVPSDASIMGDNGDEPHFSAFGADKPVTVKVKFLDKAPMKVDVRPLSKSYNYTFSGDELTITLKTYDRISIEPDGDTDSPLFIFVNPVEQEALYQAKKDYYTKVYEAGQVYDAGELSFLQKDHIYIQGGAVVKGVFLDKSGASNVSLKGCGILDCRQKNIWNGVQVVSSKNLQISNLIVLNKMYWSIRLDLCDNAMVDNVKVIAICPENDRWDENDAFHLIGCTNTTFNRCFGYAWDDVFNIGTEFNTTSGETYGCAVKDCIAWNVHPGNCFEIGWTMNKDNHDNRFENCYAIHSGTKAVKNYRAGVSIHHKGHGNTYNISYENIYIEDPTEHGIFLSIQNDSEGNGQVHDITMKNVHILKKAPRGITFRGVDSEHMLRNVTVTDLYIEGVKVTESNIKTYESKEYPMVYYDNINFN